MILTTLSVVILIMLIPSFQAVEKELMEEELEQSIKSNFSQMVFSLGSFLKKIWGIFEIMVGIGLSIGITQLLSILVLPIVLEIGLGPIVFLLLMSVLLTIPFELLNGVCLLIQKQFSLGKFKTIFLTIFTFFIYVVGNLLVTFSIPL